jgi:hypothetical protein
MAFFFRSKTHDSCEILGIFGNLHLSFFNKVDFLKPE